MHATPSRSAVFLSVIIPSFNEKRNLKRGVLDQVVKYLSRQSYTWEVVLADDGSTDGTGQELDAFAQGKKKVRVLHLPHAGKGPTVQSGMLAATGQWRLFTDFDQSTPINEVELLLAASEHTDIIIGSREIHGAVRAKEPLYRHLMGKGWNFFVQLLAVPGIQDTQCGFKLFSAAATEQLFPKLHVCGRAFASQRALTGAFDVELLFLARKFHLTIKEIPVAWKHYHTNRVSAIRDSLRMFRDLLRIRLADLSGVYR